LIKNIYLKTESKLNMVNSKFKLAIVNLWNGKIHGQIPDNEIPNEEQLSKYFINDSSINIEEFFDKGNYRYIGRYIKMMNTHLVNIMALYLIIYWIKK
jgi:hypothetical protein